MKRSLLIAVFNLVCTFLLNSQGVNLVSNGDFEKSELTGWILQGDSVGTSTLSAHSGKHALGIASACGASLMIALQPSSTYKLSAWLKTSSGAGEIQLRVIGLGHSKVSVASALADWVEINQDFATGLSDTSVTLELFHPEEPLSTIAWADNISIVRTGGYVAVTENGVKPLLLRQPRSDLGVRQQPNDKMEWLLDARLGMMIHWGLYAGPGKGEWYMENNGILPEDYRQLAYPASGSQYFAADSVDTDSWARLAKDAGMGYMCMVTMHHDGYALYDGKFLNAFTSKQTHNRDFVKEYVNSCRKFNMKVGLYKTLINWRYPGYYDVTGKKAVKNKFGYTSDTTHKENARLMKEELYADVRHLMTDYGKIDYLFWDGGWLGQQGGDAAAAYFWEPGKYIDQSNGWPVNPYFTDFEASSNRPLGLMGMVRKHQPDIISNARSGWIGDYSSQEGGATITGPIRSGEVLEKCMSLGFSWGYSPLMEDSSRIVSFSTLKRMLADCVIRNMALMLNVGPDRHGIISKAQQQRLMELGKWTSKNAEAIYGTKGGPWNPRDGAYGYAFKGNTIYVFLLEGFKGNNFILPAINPRQKLVRAYYVSGRQAVKAYQDKKRVISFQVDKKDNVVEIIAIELNRPVYPSNNN